MSKLITNEQRSPQTAVLRTLRNAVLGVVVCSILTIVAIVATNKLFLRPTPPVATAEKAVPGPDTLVVAPPIVVNAETPPLVPSPNVPPDPSIARFADAPGDVLLQVARQSIADEQATHLRNEARDNARLSKEERSTLAPKKETIRAVQDGRIMLQ